MKTYLEQFKQTLTEKDYSGLLTALNSTALVSITDKEGTILYANEKFVEVSKYSREELIGQNHRILKSNQQPQELFINLWATISKGNLWRGEIKNRAKDGTYYWVDTSIVPILDEQGSPERYISVCFLVTEKTQIQQEMQQKVDDLERAKKAMLNLLEDIEEAKARDEAIIFGIGDGLVTTDKNGSILFINDVFRGILGWTLEEIKGKKFIDVVPMFYENGTLVLFEDRLITKALKGKKKETTPIPSSLFYKTKSGLLIPVMVTASPIILEGEVVGTVEVFRDITKEKQIDKAKTEFVSLASHQLRTPLSSINWYTEMLLVGDAGELNLEQKKYLNEVYKGNQRMVSLVNALLNVSRLDLGTFMIDPKLEDIVEISKSVIEELAPQIEMRNVKLEQRYEPGLPEMYLDENLIRNILQNILSNAIKYTPSGGSISFSINKKTKGELVSSFIFNESSILISVSDTGYGIPEHQKDKIFTKLFRADNIRDHDTDGSGLGLYITKSILTEAGGSIWFDSTENKGSVFYVTIPLLGMRKREGAKMIT